MDEMKKMTFFGFVSHERLQLFAGICIFGIEVPQSIFVMVTLLLTLLQNEHFLLTLTTQTVPVSNRENCSVDDSLFSVARTQSNFIMQSINLGRRT